MFYISKEVFNIYEGANSRHTGIYTTSLYIAC